jgi:hypothetical protein
MANEWARLGAGSPSVAGFSRAGAIDAIIAGQVSAKSPHEPGSIATAFLALPRVSATAGENVRGAQASKQPAPAVFKNARGLKVIDRVSPLRSST